MERVQARDWLNSEMPSRKSDQQPETRTGVADYFIVTGLGARRPDGGPA